MTVASISYNPIPAPLHSSRLYHVGSESTAHMVVFALMAADRYATMTAGISGWFVETRPAPEDIAAVDQIVRSMDPTAFVPGASTATLLADVGLATGTGRWSAVSLADSAGMAPVSVARVLQSAAL